MKQLAQGSVDIRMDDYGDMEKVGSLGFSLPRNDRQTTTAPGDLILYQGNSFVIYYDTNSWNFTRLGKVDGVSSRNEMLDLLGGKGEVLLHPFTCIHLIDDLNEKTNDTCFTARSGLPCRNGPEATTRYTFIDKQDSPDRRGGSDRRTP